MTRLILALVLFLSACATTTDMRTRQADAEFQSVKTPVQAVACISDTLDSVNVFSRKEYSVTPRPNGAYAVDIAKTAVLVDVTPAPSGSDVKIYKQSFGIGLDGIIEQVRSCS